jgi:hypothetical protein
MEDDEKFEERSHTMGASIWLEKGFEAVLREIVATIGPDLAERCPAVLTLDRAIEILKESNNEEIAEELGIRMAGPWKCPCQEGKT